MQNHYVSFTIGFEHIYLVFWKSGGIEEVVTNTNFIKQSKFS